MSHPAPSPDDRPSLITPSHALNLDLLRSLSEPPPLFAPGEPHFWDDPHISQGMLAAHLSPDTDAASRRPATIEQTVRWLITRFKPDPGDQVLDLGCGPGLYAERLARAGLRVTGIDVSQRSLDYARQNAARQRLVITYRRENFLALDDFEQYALALQIYGELNTFAPDVLADLLRRVYRALQPGGWFIFDVTTAAHSARYRTLNGWQVLDSGFWKPEPHLVLERSFHYPEASTHCDQYVVVTTGGTVSVYRNWFVDYTRESITAVLEKAGFAVRGIWSDLAGAPYHPATEWLGVAAQRPA